MTRANRCVIVNTMMAKLSHDAEFVRTEEDMEQEANRNLAKRLTGARLHLIGQTVTNYLEHTPDNCPVCERGEKQAAYDKAREHAVCLACGRCTKYLQRSINAVLRTLEQQKKFWRNYRLRQIKFRVKGVGRGNHSVMRTDKRTDIHEQFESKHVRTQAPVENWREWKSSRA